MAPKKRSVKTVMTAKKVVEETVKMVVTPQGKDTEKFKVISTSTKEDKNIEFITTTPDDAEEEDDETQPASEPQTIPEPPNKPAVKTPQKDEKPKEKAKKSIPVKISSGEGRKRKKRRGVAAGEGGEGYKRYVFKVMKQVHPDMGISSKSMTIINNYMTDMFERLADEAAKLQAYSGKKTMSAREVQGAVKLVLPGELGKHAIAEGTKAVTNYVNFVAQNKVKS